MRHGARSIVAGVAGACALGLVWGLIAAPPAAAARGSANVSVSPNHGGPQAVFTATLHLTTNTPGGCQGGQADFAFDSQPVGSAPLDQSCSATAQIQVPLGAAPGAHKVRGTVNSPAGSASGSANFTVDATHTTSSPSSSTATTSTSSTSSPSFSTPPPSWSNSTTPVAPWTAPPFKSQPIPTSFGPCDTSGPHAPAPDKSFLMVPAYSAGAHPANTGSTLITEPSTGALPITAVGPAGMVPPLLGDGRHPYQYLEVLQPIDPNVSPKLRLAAAATRAPVPRGAGPIARPPPSSPLSYSNLVFAFGGLVAATVALMFAYHSRRRDLTRRARRQRATHA